VTCAPAELPPLAVAGTDCLVQRVINPLGAQATGCVPISAFAQTSTAMRATAANSAFAASDEPPV